MDAIHGLEMSEYFSVFNEINWNLTQPRWVYGVALGIVN